MNESPADQAVASHTLATDSALRLVLEFWSSTAGTVTELGVDNTEQTNATAMINTLAGAGHVGKGRRDTISGCRADTVHQGQVGCAHLHGQDGSRGLPRHLLCVVQRGLSTGVIQQIQAPTALQVTSDKTPAADGYCTVYVRTKSGGPWTGLILVEMHPSWPEATEDSYVLRDAKPVTPLPPTVLLA